MINFFLGIIVGMIVLTTCLTLIYILLRNNLTKVKQVVNKLQKLGTKNSILIDPEDNQVSGWVDNLPGG